MKSTIPGHSLGLLLAAALLVGAGCGRKAHEKTPAAPGQGRAAAGADRNGPDIETQIAAKWGKNLSALPAEKLILISPHSENIQYEFQRAYNLDYALRQGRRVEFEWRDVGGGTSTIVQYLRNVYAHADTSDIDVLWGGGEATFKMLKQEGVLHALQFPEGSDVLANIPAQWGGVELRDPDLTWCGSAMSGFGLLYNRQLVEMRGLKPPARWEDLGDPKLFGLVALADPSQSGSAAAAYEMIVQSAPSWPEGWAKLLAILGNAKRFYDSAGDAASAPGLGEALAATAIDFYGTLRVMEAPETLVYISPKGQTAFTPDPIAILKNPPHAALAQDFVNYVLSMPGQMLWALPVGQPGGPRRDVLGRQPIRTDVYASAAGRLLPWIANPYAAGSEMKVDFEMKKQRDDVLKRLVRAAAVDNRDGLRAAREKLIATGFPPDKVAEFNRLPADVADADGIQATAKKLLNPTETEKIVSAWQQFFREKYGRVAAAANP